MYIGKLTPDLFLHHTVECLHTHKYWGAYSINPLNPTYLTFIWNDFEERSDEDVAILKQYLKHDLNEAMLFLHKKFPEAYPQKIYGRPLVCLAPKLSKKTSESKSQALIKEQFRVAMKGKYNLEDGLDCIEREADLSAVYVGSTKETCRISEQIIDRFVILVDDEYVANLHEDIIQALFEKGAKNVLLYTLANVIKQPSLLW